MKAQLNANSGEVTTIRLYGKLGARFGRVHRLAVSSAAEAVSALGSQLQGFNAYLTRSKDNCSTASATWMSVSCRWPTANRTSASHRS